MLLGLYKRGAAQPEEGASSFGTREENVLVNKRVEEVEA